MSEYKTYPLIPLRGICVFPYMSLPFDVGREKSLAALSVAMGDDQVVFLVAQRDVRNMEPDIDDLHAVGTVCKIKQVLALPGDSIRVMVTGSHRAKLHAVKNEEAFQIGEVEILDAAEGEQTLEQEAMMRVLMDVVEEYGRISSKANGDTLLSIASIKEAGQMADLVAADLLRRVEDKQTILELVNVRNGWTPWWRYFGAKPIYCVSKSAYPVGCGPNWINPKRNTICANK